MQSAMGEHSLQHMPFSRIEPRTLHQEVAGRIREMISTGVLVKGQKISEKFLCDTMGVSRTPVRESLRILHSEGLVDLVPHKGAFVSQPTMKEICDLFEVMSVLEGTCARLAVQKMKIGELETIRSLHQRLETHYARRDHKAYLDANHDFHVFIQELSGNPVLNDMINGLRQKILLYRHRQLYQPERFRRSIEEHRMLLEALESGDADRAEVLMKRHLLRQCEALVGLFPEG
jgi:DNA-binding GntR family transcriptional regulator